MTALHPSLEDSFDRMIKAVFSSGDPVFNWRNYVDRGQTADKLCELVMQSDDHLPWALAEMAGFPRAETYSQLAEVLHKTKGAKPEAPKPKPCALFPDDDAIEAVVEISVRMRPHVPMTAVAELEFWRARLGEWNGVAVCEWPDATARIRIMDCGVRLDQGVLDDDDAAFAAIWHAQHERVSLWQAAGDAAAKLPKEPAQFRSVQMRVWRLANDTLKRQARAAAAHRANTAARESP